MATGPAGAVEGVMCPSLGGTREDLFWGHYLLLSHRLSVHEASPMEQGRGLAPCLLFLFFFFFFFSLFLFSVP